MAQIGVSLGLTLPEVGGDFGVWGPVLNGILTDFADAIEGGVSSSAALTITGDLGYGGYAITDAGVLYFRNKEVEFTPSSCIYERDGELYFNDALGNQVKLTEAGTINAAGVAGIGGDYGGSDPAAVVYNDATSKFIFTTDPNKPASMEVGNLIIGRTGETSPNKVTVQTPASLAAAYTYTLPATLPASTSLLAVSNTGTMTHTLTPSVTSLTASGTITAALGVIVGFGAATVNATTWIKTAEGGIRHADDTMPVPACDMYPVLGPEMGNAVLTQSGGGSAYWTATNSGSRVQIPLRIPVGSRLKSITVYMLQGASGNSVLSVFHDAVSSRSSVGTPDTSTGGADSSLTVTVTESQIGLGGNLYAEFDFGSVSVSSARLYSASYVYDKVA